VKDFVREYWKTAAAGAAGAFLISLLVGLVTRNPFGVVILRALLLAVLFAGLGAGLRYLVRTYLPELAEPDVAPRAGAGSTKGDGRGGRVDIVLPEENPPGMRHYGTDNQDQRGAHDAPSAAAGADMGEESALFDAGLGDAKAAQSESDGLAELAEELGEELSPSEDAEKVRGDDEVEAGRGGGTRSHDKDTEGSPDFAGLDSGRREDLDSLPDISNLEVSAESGPSAVQEGIRSSGERPEDAVRGAVSGQDPATIAKAIRTVLRRDEKG
jgi:hypothetical protein